MEHTGLSITIGALVTIFEYDIYKTEIENIANFNEAIEERQELINNIKEEERLFDQPIKDKKVIEELDNVEIRT